MARQSIRTGSEHDTLGAGRRLAEALSAGDIVILSGSLGMGKTVFVRGLAEGLGLDPRQVHSPSFTILSEYGPGESGRRLIHLDLYRIDDPAEIEDLGLTDYLAGDCVIAVEWGEKLPARFQDGAVRVLLEDAGGDERNVEIVTP